MERELIFTEIDIQNDFMNEDGALYVPNAESLKPTILSINKFASSNGYTIIATGDSHIKEDAEFEINGGPFPFHCMAGTEGEKRIEGLSEPTKLFTKHTYDIGNEDYFEDAFKELVKESGDKITFVMYGVATDYCVTAAVDTFLKLSEKNNFDVKLIIISDAIIGIDKNNSDALINKWNNNDKMNVMTFDRFKTILNKG